jgi:hypothetical protein
MSLHKRAFSGVPQPPGTLPEFLQVTRASYTVSKMGVVALVGISPVAFLVAQLVAVKQAFIAVDALII